METLGKEQSSEVYWHDVTEKYVQALEGDYHKHRLEVAFSLIPKELYHKSANIIDFGCGDAVMFPPFLEKGVNITGIDIIEEMIVLAKERLRQKGYDQSIVKLGDVKLLREYKDQSIDAVLCFNVLAYLTDDEEKIFYEQVKRILKPNGYFAVSHSNELFDLFSLNRYTLNFFNTNFMEGIANESVDALLTNADKPEAFTAYNVRENPLTYKFKLLKHGLVEIRQEFSNLHIAPPAVLKDKYYPNTIGWEESERWKLMFMCSTYMSLSRMNNT